MPIPWIFLSFKPLQKFRDGAQKEREVSESCKVASNPLFGIVPRVHRHGETFLRYYTRGAYVFGRVRRKFMQLNAGAVTTALKMAPGPRKIFITLSDQMRNF